MLFHKTFTFILLFLIGQNFSAQCESLLVIISNVNYNSETPFQIFDDNNTLVYENPGINGGGLLDDVICLDPNICYSVHSLWFFEISSFTYDNVVCTIANDLGQILTLTDFSVVAPCGNSTPGCTNWFYCNYNPTANWDDGSCITGEPDIEATFAVYDVLEDPAYVFLVNETEGDELTYLWDFGDGETSTEQFPSHYFSEDGTYTICLSIENSTGCTDIFCLDISAEGSGEIIDENGDETAGFGISVLDPTIISVEETEIISDFNIYPIPTSNTLNITLDSKIKELTYEIYDNSGRMVSTQVISDNTEILNINVSLLKTGIYTLMIRSKNQNISKSFSIIK